MGRSGVGIGPVRGPPSLGKVGLVCTVVQGLARLGSAE